MGLAAILRENDALLRVTGFARRSAHITLAMHAALPLGLTPDMLHLIRINFVREAPWIAEADVLLSPLCREVGGELYEMPPDTRELLLDELQSDPEFGLARLQEVAEFVYEYSVRALREGNVNPRDEMHDFYEAQIWAALAYICPEEAAQSLGLALKKGLQANRQAEVVRVARLAQGLATPLLSEETILVYSAALEHVAAGKNRDARDFFEALGPLNQPVSIGVVELPPPSLILPASSPLGGGDTEPKKKEPREKKKASIFSIDILRARNGDCLILHYGSPDDPGLAIIDGGPANVYNTHLKPRLQQIKDARGLEPDASLPVDLLMVSHASDEHMHGILSLTKDLVVAHDSNIPTPFDVRRCWHNSINDIIGNSPTELVAVATSQFGPAALSGEADVDDIDPAFAKVLANVSQQNRLSDDMRRLSVMVNPEFDGMLVVAKKKARKIEMGKGLTFTVIGPMIDEVQALQKSYDMFLTASPKTSASFSSVSRPNAYSIVVLAEVNHKRMLLTGDARPDSVLQGLEQAGLLKNDGNSQLHVDVLKVPQHGSHRSVDPIFFQRVTADHYIFSGDGDGGNPERGTLEMLLEMRGDEDYSLHFTYPIKEIDMKRKESWQKKQSRSKTEIPNWSNKSQNLQSLFNDNPNFAKKIRIVSESEPDTINLLDMVGS